MPKIKRVNSKSEHCAAAACCAILLLCLAVPAYCEEDGTALMLEISPPEGGYLNISSGVHIYGRFTEVTLTATPKPGYQFVYWLGSVSDSTHSSTSVFLDSPKMVIAVFERTEFKMVGIGEEGGGGISDSAGTSTSSDSGSGGGLARSGGASDSSLEQAEGGPKRSSSPHEHIPVPVPEPATVTLLFAGFLMLFNYRRKGANTTEKT
jgi:hypothetical protein